MTESGTRFPPRTSSLGGDNTLGGATRGAKLRAASDPATPSEVGTGITLASRPSDVRLPPRSSRLYGRSGRAALTAGTLTPVGDNTAREDAERDGVARDADRCYLHDVEHVHTLDGLSEGHKSCSTSSTPLAESAYARSAHFKGYASQYVESDREKAKYAEHVRQARLRRWQTIR